MKDKIYLALVLALVLILATVSTVSAKNNITYFTSVVNCDWDSIQFLRQIFNREGNWHTKLTATCYQESSIPQATGTVDIYENINGVGSHQDGEIIESKARWVTDEGGIWEMNCHSPLNSFQMICVSKGEGIYKGLEMFSIGAFPPDGLWNGYIVDHGK